MDEQFLLGIDGGGTKTRALLARAGQQGGPGPIIVQASGGPSNPRAVGVSQATDVLGEVIEQVQQKACTLLGRDEISLAAATFALAGVASEDVRRSLEAWAGTTLPKSHAAFVSDGEPILAAGTTDGRGVALIAGTGSSAFARDNAGQLQLVGGWGYLLGDEGSGFAIGQRAIREIVLQLDGRATRTSFCDVILSDLGIEAETELKQSIYESPDPRQTIAALANVVLQVAEKGDPVGQVIAQQGAAELAQLASQAARVRGKPPQQLELAVSGSLLTKNDFYFGQLTMQLDLQGATFSAIERVADPAVGCLILAERLLTQ